MLSSEQERIYQGLQDIGSAIANYYLDAVRLIDPSCTLQSKANLIAHLAREIDGGLRDVFAPSELKEIHDKQFKAKGISKMSHFSSILAAVRKNDPEDKIAKEWYAIASNFHAIAHRNGVYKESKDTQEMLSLWFRFEKVLGLFIGSNYSILRRLDDFIALNEPPKDVEALPALWNLLNNSNNYFYFFSKLDKPLWLDTLIEAGFFEIKAAPIKTKTLNHFFQWMPIMYLANISSLHDKNVEEKITGILTVIMNGYLNNEIDLHPYTVTDVAKITSNIEPVRFTKINRLFFKKFTRSNTNDFWLAYQSILTKDIPQKLLQQSDKDSVKEMLLYVFGFDVSEEPGIQIDDISLDPFAKINPTLGDYHLDEFISSNGEQLIELLGTDAIEIVVTQLKELIKIEGSYQFSSSSIPSIEETDQISINNPWHFSFVTFIRDYLKFLSQEDQTAIINEFLNYNIEIFKRLAIHFIRINFSSNQSTWWNYISTSAEPIYIHEPFVLLDETSDKYSDEQIKMIVDWIETTCHFNVGNAATSNFTAYTIRKWLTSLHPSTPESQELLYNKMGYYGSINDYKIEHASFDSYSSITFGNEPPIPLETFRKYSVEQQVEFIKNYRQQAEYETHEQGLSDVLENCVKVDPEKYLYKLELFFPIHTFYLQSVITGLSEAIRENKIVDAILIIDFIEKELQNDTFNNEQPKKFLTKNWFVNSVAELLMLISNKNDYLKLSKDELERLIDLNLGLLYDKQYRNSTKIEDSDFHNYLLNNTTGKLHSALFDLAVLWDKCFSLPGNRTHWLEKVKEYFISRLDRSDDVNKEFSFIVGERLPFFLYFDNDWVNQNVNNIFSQNDDFYFDTTLFGALSGYFKPRRGVHNLLRENGLFSLAVLRLNNRSSALDRLILYGILEWQTWGVSYDSSILRELIDRKDNIQIAALIEFIIRNKRLHFEEIRFIWQKLSEVFNQNPGNDDGESYAMTLWFYEFAPVLDEEIYRLVDEALSTINKGTGVFHFLLKSIFDKADTNLPLSAELVKKIFVKKLMSPHHESSLVSFVTKLYIKGLYRIADEICLAVSATGALLLKEVYESNKDKFLEG